MNESRSYSRTRVLLVLLLALLGGSAPVAAQCVEWTHLSTANGDLEPPTVDGEQQTSALIFDLDKDGYNDFVISERRSTPSMVWYRRDAAGWTKFLIDDTLLPIEAGGAFHDIDGDGDIDVVMGADSSGDEVWWWENPYPVYDGSPWTRRNILSTGDNQYHDMMFGDFDNDGAAEFVFWNQGDNFSLKIAEIPANPLTSGDWTPTTMFSSPVIAEGLAQGDVDGDGLIDIVGGGYWFKFAGGTSYTAMPVDPLQAFGRAAVGQLVPGGYAEIVFVVGDTFAPGGITGMGPIRWYEWDGSAWVGNQLLGFDVENGHSLDIVDFDGDGNLDIFNAEMRLQGGNADSKVWAHYGDGAGNFETTVVATGFDNHESKVGDLDGDGDLDILGKPFDTGVAGLNIWINNQHKLDQWERRLIDDTLPERCIFVDGRDVDGDGDVDLIGGAWWWENPGTFSTSWTRHTVGAPMNNMAWVHDIDGDGDADIFGSNGEFRGDVMSWAQNDGSGNFTIHNIGSAGIAVDSFFQGSEGAILSPGEPYKIFLSWQNGAVGVQSFTIPADPVNDPWPIEIISPSSQGEDLTAIDLDGDNDLDIYQGTQWLRNDGGGSFTPITANGITSLGLPDRHVVTDVDLDGDLDAVLGFAHYTGPATEIIWLESPANPEQTWGINTIDTGVGGGWSVDAADLDGDRDVDVVLGEHEGAHRMIVYENNGDGSSFTPFIVDPGAADIDHHDSANLVDVDGDGDLDILSVGWLNWKVFVYENKSVDCNPDLVPPTDPTNLTGVPVSGTKVLISWDESTDDVEIGGYQVSRDGVVVATSVAPQYLDAGLFPGVDYDYTVAAVDSSGNVSGASNQLTIAPGNPSIMPDPTLYAGYGFEGSGSTIDDESGNGNTGTLIANATREATGYLGQGGVFDGSSGHVDLNNLDIPGPAMTIMLWCKPESFGIADARIISKASGTGTDDHYWMISTYNGSGVRVRVRAGNNTRTLVAPGANLSVGQWAHLALTYDGAEIRVYQNGALVGNVAKTGNLAQDPAVPAYIGDNPSGGKVFDGSVDEVRIYNRALDPSEIQFVSNVPLVAPPADLQAPSVPNGLAAVALGPDQVHFTWNASTDNEGVEGYRVFRDGTLIASVLGVTEFFDSGLTPDMSFTYSAAAFDDSGNQSATSATVGVTTPILDVDAPTPPSSIAASGTSFSTVSVVWSGSVDNLAVDTYYVLRDGEQVATLAHPIQNFLDTGLASGRSYDFSIVAVDAAGNESAPSAISTATTSAAGFEPAVLAAYGFDEVSGDTVFDVSGNGNDATYSSGVERTMGYAQGALEFGGLIGHVDLGNMDIAGNELTIALWFNANNFDDPFARLISKANSGAPAGHWWMVSTYAGNVLRFRLKTTSGVTETLIADTGTLQPNVWTHVAVTYNGATMRIYKDGVEVGSEGHSGAIAVDPSVFARIGDSPTSGAAFDGSIDEVWIMNRALSGAEINTLMNMPVSAPVNDMQAPTVPTGVSASALSSTEVLVTWNPSSDDLGVSGYDIFESGSLVGTTSGAVTQFTDTGLTQNTTYSYTARARDAVGNLSGLSSPPAVVTTPVVDSMPPTAPTGLVANALSGTEVQLDWGASTDDTALGGYRIRRGGAVIATVGPATTQFNDTTAVPAMTYSYDVVAFDTAGNTSGASNTAMVTTPFVDVESPSAPVATAIAQSETVVNVTWTAATDNVGVAGYRVREGGVDLMTFGPAVFQFTHTGLTAGTTYVYDVVAFDAAGNETGSALVLVTTFDLTPPTAPTGLSGLALGGTSIQIDWTAATDNVGVAGYRVRRDGAVVATLAAVTQYVDNGLSPNTSYIYDLIAFDAAGLDSPASGSTTVTTIDVDIEPPTAPPTVTATAVSDTEILVSWTAATDNVGVVSYRVRRDGTPVATLGNTVFQFLNTGLAATTTYNFSVIALDAEGNESPSSPVATATTQAPAFDPFLLAAYGFESGGATTIDVTGHGHDGTLIPAASRSMVGRMGSAIEFNGNGGHVDLGRLDIQGSALTIGLWFRADDFDVKDGRLISKATGVQEDDHYWMISTFPGDRLRFRLKTVGGTTETLISSGPAIQTGVWTHVAVTYDGALMRIYQDGVLVGSGAHSGGIAQAPSVDSWIGDNPGTSSREFDGLIDEVWIFERALDVTEIGTLLTTPILAPVDDVRPTPPTGVSGIALSANEVRVSWTASTDNVGVTGYRVLRDGAPLATTPGTEYTDTTTVGATTYSYVVLALDAAGNESFESMATLVTTPTPDTMAPTQPVNVFATAISTDEVLVTWNPSTDNVAVTGYRVLRDGAVIDTVGANPTEYSDNTVTGSTTYSYSLIAFDGAGNSSVESNAFAVTTPAPDVMAPTAPSSVAATALSLSEILVTWAASTDDTGVTEYRVSRRGTLIATLPATALQYLDDGLNSATSYMYTVVAADAAGNTSAPSNVATATTFAAPTNPSLLAAYGFEGSGSTVLDVSGNANDGTLIPSAVRSGGGQFGSAVEFDGSSGRVELGTLDVSGDQLTIAAWFRPDDFDTKDARIVSKATGVSANDHVWMVSTFTNGRLRFRLKTSTDVTNTLISNGPEVLAGEWTHVAATYDGSLMRLYQNGVLVGTEPHSGTIAQAPTVAAWIGDNPGGSSRRFDGLVDELFIFEAELDAAEIMTLMTTPAMMPGDTQSPTAPTNVAAVANSATEVVVTWTGSTDNVGVTSYRVLRDGGMVGTTAGGTTQFTDLAVAENTTYNYTVVAADAAGNFSPASSPVATVQTPFADSVPPTAPTGLVGNVLSGTMVDLSWIASTDNVELGGYRVRRNGSVIATVGPFTTSFLDSAAPSDSMVTYDVISFDLATNETPSAPITVQTPFVDTNAPSQPVVTATPLGETSVQVSWTPSTDDVAVTGYRVRRDGAVVAIVGPGTVQFLDNGLAAGTMYGYAVVAFDAAGNETSSVAVLATTPDLTAPSAPTGLMGTALSSSEVQLTWNAATDNVGVVSYQIRRDGAIVMAVNAPLTQYVDTGLDPNTGYAFEVFAVDAAGLASVASNLVNVTTEDVDTVPPSAPGNLMTTSLSSSSIQLDWLAATDNVGVAGYRVLRDGVPVATLGAATLQYVDTSLAADTQYTYTVAAFDAEGNETPTAPVSETTQPSPVDPTLIAAYGFEELSGTNVLDTTGQGNDGVLVPNASRSSSGYFFQALEVDGSAGHVDLGTLDVVGTELTIALWFKADAFGVADARLISKAIGTAESAHYWMISTLGGDRLRFRLKTSTGNTETLVGSTDIVADTWYHVTATYDGSNMRLYLDGVAMGSTPHTGAVATDPTVAARIGDNPTDGKVFDGLIDEVFLFNRALGAGEIAALMATQAGTPPVDNEDPTAPTGLTALAPTHNQVDLTWEESTDNFQVVGYRVLRDGSVIATTGTELTYSDTTVSELTSYDYSVVAVDAASNLSPASNVVTVMTPELDVTPPTAPTNLAGVRTSSTAVQLGWTAAFDANGVVSYTVIRDGSDVGSTPLTSFLDLTATPDTNHTYEVVALDASGNESPPSASIMVQTPEQTFDPALVAAYGFEDGGRGTVFDVSGNGNDGTLAGAARGPGYFGEGISGNGIAGDVNLGTLDVVGGTGLTIAMWCRPNTFDVSDSRLISKASSTAPNGHYWMISTIFGNQLRFRLKTEPGDTETLVADAPSLTTGVWSHVAVTYDGANMRIFQDGIEIGSTPKTGQVFVNPAVFATIGDTPGGSKNFDGDIDEVWIYNRALSAGELMALMTTNVGAPPPDETPPTTPTNVVGYAASTSRVDLHWTPAVDSVGVTLYRVLRGGTEIGTSTTTEYQDNGLTANTSYDYQIVAEDAAGNMSLASTALAVSTLVDNLDEWFGAAWNYRVPVVVDPAGKSRTDKPVELDMDFTALLSDLGAGGSLDQGSIRVIEVNAAGQVIDSAVPFQFDPDPAFNASSNAVGQLVFLSDGWLPGTALRFYHVYFNTGSSMTAPTFPSQITLTDNVIDEGQSSYQIETPLGTYLYQKDAGGFSSLLDLDGNDWIDFHPTGGSAGSFRGIPNLVFPESQFHPGDDTSTSTILRQGPLVLEIHSITNNGLWECVWEIFPQYARLTVLSTDHPYWFLYEGTPGGALEVDSDYVVRPDGTLTFASVAWNGDLPGEEWAYFGDPVVGRGLFLVNHQDDTANDMYTDLSENMTVFGFGRDGGTPLMTAEPAQFTIGFLEDPAFTPASRHIHASYLELVITTGLPVMQGSVATAPTTPQNLTATTQSDSEILLDWDASSDNVAIEVYEIRRDGVIVALVSGSSYTDSELQQDTGYLYEVVARDAQGNTSAASNQAVATTLEGLFVNVWYGPQQRFGNVGLAQTWVNILGNASDPDGIASLTYSLNSGPDRSLSLGPDLRRLWETGDFNVELLNTELLPGLNTVSIKATDTLGNERIQNVEVDYSDTNVWPIPYNVDWSTVSDLQDVCQVVDGLWGIDGGGLRTQELGYDRVVGIGDGSWTDYEVEVRVTVNSIDFVNAFGAESGAPAVGLIMRWSGHSVVQGAQPNWGFYPLGCIAWFRWNTGSEKYQLAGNQGVILDADSSSTNQLQVGTEYIFKVQVETVGGNDVYRLKSWVAGQVEPSTWLLQGQQSSATNPANGGFLLVGHHVDVTFGEVNVRTLP